MDNQRVTILDGSRSLFELGTSSTKANQEDPDEHLGLQPIPGLELIVAEAVRSVASTIDVAPGKIAVIDVGVICDTSIVRCLGQAIHSRVLQKLLGR
jgi:mediator of RNA polymerase II transcription subunit 14